MEAHRAFPELAASNHLRLQILTEANPLAHRHLTTRTHQRLPIARMQKSGEFTEAAILPATLLPINHQHSGGRAIGQGLLGNLVFGKVKIEIGQLHPDLRVAGSLPASETESSAHPPPTTPAGI